MFLLFENLIMITFELTNISTKFGKKIHVFLVLQLPCQHVYFLLYSIPLMFLFYWSMINHLQLQPYLPHN